jgi:anti-sigma regulatory factor (Ser/Thr protein kinase)
MTQSMNTRATERIFSADTASIGEARRFVRDIAVASMNGRGDDLLGDVELAVSELVTNAVEYGLDEPVAVRVTITPASIVVSVRSARTSSAIADPSTWAGPLPAMRTGRGLAIVRSVSDDVSVDADDSTVTVHSTFRLI